MPKGAARVRHDGVRASLSRMQPGAWRPAGSVTGGGCREDVHASRWWSGWSSTTAEFE